MGTATNIVEEVGNGVDVWREFKRFGWGIVAMASAIVGALIDNLEWVRGGIDHVVM